MAAKSPPKLEKSIVNPFLNDTRNNSVYGTIKLILLFPVAILRVLLIFVLVLINVLIAAVAVAGTPVNAPLSEWRRQLVQPIRYVCRVILFILGFYNIPVTGQREPSKASILVSNHVSIIEPLFFTFAGTCHVAKKEISKIFGLGLLGRALEILYIDRGDADSCSMIKQSISERAKIPSDYPQLCIYPEGTTTNGKAIVQFKYGAFLPGQPVQVAVVRYRYIHFDPSYTSSDYIWLLRMLSQFVQYMEVHYVDIHVPTPEEKASAPLYAEAVRQTMGAYLNIPLTQHAVGDALLSFYANLQGLPRSVGTIEYGSIKKMLHLNMADLKEYMHLFSRVDKDKDGRVSIVELAELLALSPDHHLVQTMFDIFDTDSTGYIDFRHFLAGLVYINENVSNDEGLDMIFKIADLDEDGKFNFEDFLRVSHYLKLEGNPKSLFGQLGADSQGYVTKDQLKVFLVAHWELITPFRKTLVFSHFKLSLLDRLKTTENLS